MDQKRVNITQLSGEWATLMMKIDTCHNQKFRHPINENSKKTHPERPWRGTNSENKKCLVLNPHLIFIIGSERLVGKRWSSETFQLATCPTGFLRPNGSPLWCHAPMAFTGKLRRPRRVDSHPVTTLRQVCRKSPVACGLEDPLLELCSWLGDTCCNYWYIYIHYIYIRAHRSKIYFY